MDNQNQRRAPKVTEGVLVTHPEPLWGQVEGTDKVAEIVRPGTHVQPAIRNLDAHRRDGGNRTQHAIVPALDSDQAKYNDMRTMAKIEMCEMARDDISIRRVAHGDAKQICKEFGVCMMCYVVQNMKNCSCECKGTAKIPRICSDAFQCTVVQNNGYIRRHAVVDALTWKHVQAGERPMEQTAGHLRQGGAGYYQQEQLMNRAEACEFIKRLICLFMCHADKPFVPQKLEVSDWM